MQKFKILILLTSILGLVLAYNNCGQEQFSTSMNSTKLACDPTAFGSLCSGNGTGTNPPPGAHGFFYNLTPILDPNGYQAPSGQYAGVGVDGSMSLLTAQDIIPNLSLYATQIDVPDQNWSQGFPGYPILQEWFGICYDASWTASATGTYTFVTAADDAFAVWIDGNLIGENDDGTINSSLVAKNTGLPGKHGPTAFAPLTLSAGPHSVEIMYYQGWPDALEAQVWAIPPGVNYQAGTTPPDSELMQLASPINGVLNCPH